MRKILLVTALAALLGCDARHTQHIPPAQAARDRAAAAFSELKEVLDAEGGRTWGHSLQGPLFLVDPATRAVYANEPLSRGAYAWRGKVCFGLFPEGMIIANSTCDWNGKHWTMVMLPLPEDRAERLELLVHESFHRIQPIIGLAAPGEIQCSHLDTEEGRTWLRMELEALARALRSGRPGPHVAEALRFRQYRHQRFPGARRAENSLEINEGMAAYTGVALSGRGGDGVRERCLDGIGRLYAAPTFVRSFAYHTIPAYGYFLRQADSAWNRRVTGRTDLTELLLEACGGRLPEQSPAAVRAAGRAYGLDSIAALERGREAERARREAEYRAMFAGRGVLVIALEQAQIGFNPGTLVPLGDRGTVYPSLTVTDSWGSLRVDSCGALLDPDWDRVTLTCPVAEAGGQVTGRGWSIRLNPGWKLGTSGGRRTLVKEINAG